MLSDLMQNLILFIILALRDFLSWAIIIHSTNMSAVSRTMHLAEVRLNKGLCLLLTESGHCTLYHFLLPLDMPKWNLALNFQSELNFFLTSWMQCCITQVKLQMLILSVRLDEVLLKLTKEVSKKYY